ncbi:MAG: hypothetical protein JF617_07440 [Burkholderiales bacterium]|nr:hypothetical protein [Burkholderiales bacterium]
MIRITELRLPLNHAEDALRPAVLARLKLSDTELAAFHVFRRGYDARKRSDIQLVYTLDCTLADGVDEAAVLARFAGDHQIRPTPDTGYHFLAQVGEYTGPRPVVVGFGPCGLFAALILAQMGLKPIVLERGKAVRERTQDTWGLWRELLFVSKPHIGTFRLVSMIIKMRADIEALGGEIRFQQKMTDLLIEDGAVRGVQLESGEQISTTHVVIALGHSARDTFTMLHARGVQMEAKPSVYSFCMCPGGTVVAATSEPDRVVTNGMSQYSRNERNANAGIVVGLTPEDYRQDGKRDGSPVNPLDGMAFQRLWESRAYELGGGGYLAPGSLVGDFVKRQVSQAFGDVAPSYKPGVTLTDLQQKGRGSLPSYALEAIREALPAFARQIRGFDRPDAVLTGVETRTSSPLRINRGRDYQSLNVRGLFPAGEGAGYAGGIMSAGVDGIEVAEALAADLLGMPDAPVLQGKGAKAGGQV